MTTDIKENEKVSEKLHNNIKYRVVRGGIQVSELEYDSITDEIALEEKRLWQSIVDRYPDNTKVEIVKIQN